MSSRIRYLDGLRGVAIASVVFFHVFSRWADLMPFGTIWARVTFFQYGHYGVQLFFMISGYVIWMTLDNSAHAGEFAFRRWKRLFPAMLMCSVLIFPFSGLWHVRLNPLIDWTSLLPGISFVAPGVWTWVTGHEFQMLEGAFWSLFVEAKFYVVAAAVYFMLGRLWLVPVLAACHLGYWGLSYLVPQLEGASGLAGAVLAVMSALSLDYFGWFAVGAAVYEYQHTSRKSWLAVALVMLLGVCVLGKVSDRANMLASLVTGAAFVLPVVWPLLQRVFATRLLVWLGAISYPLYLLHENASIALTNEIVRWWPSWPAMLALALALAVIAGLAACVAFVFEPWAQRKLNDTLGQALRDRTKVDHVSG